MEHGSEYESKESWSNLVDLVCGFFFFCRGWLVFFPIFLVVVGGDLVRLLLIFFWSNGGCGCGG